MAKRKRLTPADPLALGASPVAVSRKAAPIADVAGDAASHAAFAEVAGELESARDEGRLIQRLPLSAIKADHLVRDRLALDEAEMTALVRSLEARGQQTPIEVVKLAGSEYGLISGWRRMEALKQIKTETVLAIVRVPDGAADAYVAMIEENEIRAGLSFYERARLAAEAARIGVYPTVAAAVAALYASSSASKRSKIMNFVSIHAELGGVLQFPSAIPERLGLALSAALAADAGLSARLKDALRKTPPADAEAERATLERAMRRTAPAGKTAPKGAEIASGVFVQSTRGRIVLSGDGIDAKLLAALKDWLGQR